jgi:hypothetical protein
MSLNGSAADARGHLPGCPNFNAAPVADENSAYVDLFCDCHIFSRPMVLANGTDVAWPAGWDEKRVRIWRDKNGLARPSPPYEREPSRFLGVAGETGETDGNEQTDRRRSPQRRR